MSLMEELRKALKETNEYIKELSDCIEINSFNDKYPDISLKQLEISKKEQIKFSYILGEWLLKYDIKRGE